MTTQLGRYTLHERIAEGGMAIIDRASFSAGPGLRKICVLKRLKPEYADRPALLHNEAHIALSLSHPHIVQGFDYGHDQETHYLVFEYIDGLDLMQVFQAARSTQTRLPAPVIAYIGYCVADALSYTHRTTHVPEHPHGVIHRDISLHNVMLSRNGAVKLIDFGAAQSHDAITANHDRPTTVMGKIAYMSPEQATGQTIDERTDIYALGVLLFELLSGRLLFRTTDPKTALDMVRSRAIPPLQSIVPAISPSLAAVIDQAVRRDPAERFATAHAFQSALAEILRTADPWVDSLMLTGVVQTLTETLPAPTESPALPTEPPTESPEPPTESPALPTESPEPPTESPALPTPRRAIRVATDQLHRDPTNAVAILEDTGRRWPHLEPVLHWAALELEAQAAWKAGSLAPALTKVASALIDPHRYGPHPHAYARLQFLAARLRSVVTPDFDPEPALHGLTERVTTQSDIPLSLEVHHLVGEHLLALHRLEPALQTFEAGLRQARTHQTHLRWAARLAHGCARTLLRLGVFTQAEALLDWGERADPTTTDFASIVRATTLVNADQFDEAWAQLDALGPQSPHHRAAMLLRADILTQRGETLHEPLPTPDHPEEQWRTLAIYADDAWLRGAPQRAQQLGRQSVDVAQSVTWGIDRLEVLSRYHRLLNRCGRAQAALSALDEGRHELERRLAYFISSDLRERYLNTALVSHFSDLS